MPDSAQPLGHEKAERLLSEWPLEIAAIEHISVHNTNFIKATTQTGDQYLMKNVGDIDDVKPRTELQYRLTNHLHNHGVPVAYLLTTRDDHFGVEDGSDLYILMPLLPREPADLYFGDTAGIFSNLGRAYARLHGALSKFDGEIDTWSAPFDRMFDGTIPRLREVLSGPDLELVNSISDAIEPPMRSLAPQLDHQIILWDCHDGNTLFWEGDVSGFVDVDHVCLGPRVTDVANMVANLVIHHQDDRMTPWLKGLSYYARAYHETSPLSEAERAAIPYGIEGFIVLLYEYFLSRDHPSATNTWGAVQWMNQNCERVHAAVASAF